MRYQLSDRASTQMLTYIQNLTNGRDTDWYVKRAAEIAFIYYLVEDGDLRNVHSLEGANQELRIIAWNLPTSGSDDFLSIVAAYVLLVPDLPGLKTLLSSINEALLVAFNAMLDSEANEPALTASIRSILSDWGDNAFALEKLVKATATYGPYNESWARLYDAPSWRTPPLRDNISVTDVEALRTLLLKRVAKGLTKASAASRYGMKSYDDLNDAYLNGAFFSAANDIAGFRSTLSVRGMGIEGSALYGGHFVPSVSNYLYGAWVARDGETEAEVNEEFLQALKKVFVINDPTQGHTLARIFAYSPRNLNTSTSNVEDGNVFFYDGYIFDECLLLQALFTVETKAAAVIASLLTKNAVYRENPIAGDSKVNDDDPANEGDDEDVVKTNWMAIGVAVAILTVTALLVLGPEQNK